MHPQTPATRKNDRAVGMGLLAVELVAGPAYAYTVRPYFAGAREG
jgi:hypothetical protein